jgi:hypothetical protein
MRGAVMQIVLGVVFIVGGYLADTYLSTPNVTVYWWGAYIAGGLFLLQGVRALMRAQKLRKMMDE